MPIFEVRCTNESCKRFEQIRETILSSYDKPNPECPSCHGPTQRIPSRCHAIWLGTLDKYNRPGEQALNSAEGGGHVAYRTRSSRLVDGAPEPVIIRTRQEQQEYCRAEGVTMPDDMPNNIDWDARSASSQGLPGCWASVDPSFLEAEAAKPLPEVDNNYTSVLDRTVDIDTGIANEV